MGACIVPKRQARRLAAARRQRQATFALTCPDSDACFVVAVGKMPASDMSEAGINREQRRARIDGSGR